MTAVLYAILDEHQVGQHGVDLSLEKACQRLNLEYRRLISQDIALDAVANMQFLEPALLYRISTRTKSAVLGSMLPVLHPETFTTIYSPNLVTPAVRNYRELTQQVAAKLNIIPTLIIDETWLQLDDNGLQAKADQLGGLPIVVKTLGSSHGRGVEKIATISDLKVLLQQSDVQKIEIIARKYLADYRHFRIIIVDDAPAAVIEYHKPADDFRTNASETPNVTAVSMDEVPAAAIDLARRSVALRSSIFGGVDILVDLTDDTSYLAEVNVPCYFTRAETPTGIDISGQLISALVRKQQKEQHG